MLRTARVVNECESILEKNASHDPPGLWHPHERHDKAALGLVLILGTMA